MPLTPYAKLVNDWKHCTKCPLCVGRRQVVFARGTVPAKVLFIGEAPGVSEDVAGRPFEGPAGQLLNRQINSALLDMGIARERLPKILTYPPSIAELPMAFYNLVGCMPKDLTGRKRGEPLPIEIAACWPRLDKFLDICKPQLIVTVGDLAAKQAKLQKWGERALLTDIVHPAFIIRDDITRQGLTHQRVIAILSDAFSELLPQGIQSGSS